MTCPSVIVIFELITDFIQITRKNDAISTIGEVASVFLLKRVQKSEIIGLHGGTYLG